MEAQDLHHLRVQLYNNTLTKDNHNDLTARVHSERTLTVADICRSAVDRGGADISAAAIEHATHLFLKEMGYRLCDGFSVNTGWFTASPHIRGVFGSPNEPFDPGKHTLSFDFHQGGLLRKELEYVSVEVTGLADSGLEIVQVIDIKSGSVNDLLTPSRNLRITGQKLKIAGDHPDVGVYFISANNNQYKVDPSDMVTNNPSELLIVIPALAAGTYRVQVVTQFSSGHLLQAPRSFTFDRPLTVN